jgi:hypothetical protein
VEEMTNCFSLSNETHKDEGFEGFLGNELRKNILEGSSFSLMYWKSTRNM